MPTYTIHAPQPQPDETAKDPERFVFVRDGFHFWALMLAPLWFIAHRMWLVLVLYVIVDLVAGSALVLLGAPWFAKSLVGLLIALIVGFEAASLRRWTLRRRGWRTLGFVVGDDRENAERRFFSEWVKQKRPAPPQASPHYVAPVRREPPSGSTDVIGLFPEPGGSS